MPPNSESPTVSEDVSRVSGVRTVTTRADSILPFVLVSWFPSIHSSVTIDMGFQFNLDLDGSDEIQIR